MIIANEQNLIPMSKRTPRERQEISRKGAEACNKKKREAKAIKYYIDLLLSMPLKNEKVEERLKEAGINPEDMDNKMAMVYMQWLEAGKGNTKAFENLLNYAGEKPIEQVQNINPPQIIIERPKE